MSNTDDANTHTSTHTLTLLTEFFISVLVPLPQLLCLAHPLCRPSFLSLALTLPARPPVLPWLASCS